MTMSCTSEPCAATADWCPQGHWATTLMNVRSNCLSELFSEHPLLQHARALHSTATLGCHKRLQTLPPQNAAHRDTDHPFVLHTPPARPGPGGLQVPSTTTEPILAHSHRHNHRLLSHCSFWPQKCRIGYYSGIFQLQSHTHPVICRAISTDRASAPTPVPA